MHGIFLPLPTENSPVEDKGPQPGVYEQGAMHSACVTLIGEIEQGSLYPR